MAASSSGPEDEGLVQVPPSSLQSASHPFHMTAKQISDLSQTLQTTLQWMVNDSMLAAELLRYALDMQQFGLALQISMECQIQALQRIGFNLGLTGLIFEGLDLQLQQRFAEVTFPGFEPDFEPNGAVFRPQIRGLMLGQEHPGLTTDQERWSTGSISPQTVTTNLLQTPTTASFEPNPTLAPESIFTAIAQENIAHTEQNSPSFQLKQQNPGLQTGSLSPSSFAPNSGGIPQRSRQSRPQPQPEPEGSGWQIGPGISFQLPSSEEEP
ncbi:hypothetical protein [Thermogemmatispora sp.]|uniref:hypothetical protein n=1 Tax=Thermogemmatispora sp. TaxID=1968838 RepID=UPI001D2F9979|nr:hypothetical protein [Thermogemmatispora sp.]MBX5452132.1 hypothetical protein [Thermogemmatispora sp.]